MAKLAILNEEEVPVSPYPAGWSTSGVRWAKRLSPDGYSIGLTVAELEQGATLGCGEGHGDEGLYVATGELEVDGRICPAGGAVIVESGVAATITARQDTRVVHCQPADAIPPSGGLNGAPEPDGHVVHVVGPDGWFQSGAREDVFTTWFADGTCPTCRISLFRVDHPGGRDGKLHSHSEDEIIFVLDGVVNLGPRGQAAGTALNIPGNVTYKNGYPGPTSFLNFRRDIAEQRSGRDGPVVVDAGLARGGRVVGDFR